MGARFVKWQIRRHGFTSVVIVSLLVTGGTARAATWTAQTVYGPGIPTAQSAAISCVSSTDCVSVGQYIDRTGAQLPFAEMWGGSSWTKSTMPVGPGASFTATALSCAGSSACVAIGQYEQSLNGYEGWAEHWNGTAWAFSALPVPGGYNNTMTQMYGVSCPSATLCLAVGDYWTTSGTWPTAMLWNGSGWTLMNPPNPGNGGAGTQDAELDGVSCSSATACTIVGSYTDQNGVRQPLVETWNGSSWSIQPSASIGSGALTRVSCLPSGFCVAVGWNSSGLVAESTTGGTWTTMSVPISGGANAGIACSSPTQCVAVGTRSIGTAQAPAAMVWNGSSWSTATPPDPASSQLPAVLGGVACPAAGLCIAAGYYSIAAGANRTLVETFNGTGWAIQPSPSPQGTLGSSLSAVSCSASTSCMAVGTYQAVIGHSQLPATLVESWNGSTWTHSLSPNPSGSNNSELDAVSCLSATYCVAAGSYYTGNLQLTLVEAWNGTRWSIQSTPNPDTAPGDTDAFAGVSCASASSCMAVGSTVDSATGMLPLAEYWNGSSWAVVPTPTVSGKNTELSAISCVSASSCEAVGSAGVYAGFEATLAEYWNGSTWTIQPTPNPGSIAALNGISCTSASACTAVGTFETSTFAEVWNGTSWSLQSVPLPGGSTGAQLSAVSCAQATTCQAVGNYSTPNANQPMVDLWSGTSWSSQGLPSSPNNGAGATGISCPASAFCFAVGSQWMFEQMPFVAKYS